MLRLVITITYGRGPAIAHREPVHHFRVLPSFESMAMVPTVGSEGSGPGTIATLPLTFVGENVGGNEVVAAVDKPRESSNEASLPSVSFTRAICGITAPN
jgi:hypothetical protein